MQVKPEFMAGCIGGWNRGTRLCRGRTPCLVKVERAHVLLTCGVTQQTRKAKTGSVGLVAGAQRCRQCNASESYIDLRAVEGMVALGLKEV